MRHNPLFLIIFMLGGCASVPPAEPLAPPAAPISALPPVAVPAPAASPRAPDALFHALAALGVDYRWGGNSRAQGFDCSGLVQHVYREAFGIELPRHTLAQSRQGQPVARAALEIGDLVFYNTLKQPYSHVGIYMGDGRFIHAPRTGAAVRVDKMDSAYWAKRFDGARRVALD
jgi:cell wall-associated NlpC family hydrolase